MPRIDRLIKEAESIIQNQRISKEKQSALTDKLHDDIGYSFGTPKGAVKSSTIKKECQIVRAFIRQTIRNHPQVHSIDGLRPYVKEYLEMKEDWGNSKDSLRREGIAIAKLFKCSFSDFNYILPMEVKEPVDYYIYKEIKKYNGTEPSYIANLALLGTGLKASQLQKLTPKDFEYQDCYFMVLRPDSKRWAIVNPNFEDELASYIESRCYENWKGQNLFPVQIFAQEEKDRSREYFRSMYNYFLNNPEDLPEYDDPDEDDYTNHRKVFTVRGKGIRYDASILRYLMFTTKTKRMSSFVHRYLEEKPKENDDEE